ncbi:hypothetical protein WG219_19265 [Ectopseudomonas mendocina]|uniref:Uncharacterized protein n=1 Tax=Ectopseudomonas mendocina TaxID=300 RepID=A0ABZ2RMR4_ECTME
MITIELLRALVDAMSLAFMVAGVVWIITSLHMCYTCLDELLEHFSGNATIMSYAALRKGGPWGKLMLLVEISKVVTFPDFYIKRNRVVHAELAGLRMGLRVRLKLNLWLCAFVLFSMCIAAFGIKFIKE